MPTDQSSSSVNVTLLLQRYANGDTNSLNAVIPVVYRELKSLAAVQLNRSGVRRHLQTTALVHEAYEKLTEGKSQHFNDRRHFFAIASRAMRQIVVDTYRAENAAKRGGGLKIAELESGKLVDMSSPDRVLQFNQAIEQLAKESEDLAEVVDLSCFAGLSNTEIAEITASNVRTVQRKLTRAKAWITHLIEGAEF